MRHIFRALGFLFCILPPALAVVDQFPLMTTGGKISLGALALLCVCAIPAWRWIKEALKSPSAWMVWGLLLGVCLAVNQVIDQLTVVAVIGFPASVVGAVFFHLAKKLDRKAAVK